MTTVTELGPRLGIAPTCSALALPRATYYRRRRPQSAPPARLPSPRALSGGERAAVLAVLHEPRFVDLAPAEVYATLLDEEKYLCSERTMYRLLAAHQEVRERRDQLRHPQYAAPELLARRPNELWSWDITKLLGPVKWTYFYLYVMLDVFSRCPHPRGPELGRSGRPSHRLRPAHGLHGGRPDHPSRRSNGAAR